MLELNIERAYYGGSKAHRNRICVAKSHTSNDDGLTDRTPSCISHSNCDTVDSVTLQLLYNVAGGGNTPTTPTSSIIVSLITTAECLPHHLISGYH